MAISIAPFSIADILKYCEQSGKSMKLSRHTTGHTLSCKIVRFKLLVSASEYL